uniref:Transient receptor potential cation channel subfamily A member 1 n=1 Tax=Cacopsylla melanoneura TaxID=428564 RepID=A0A8D8VMJ4_9HEMI
MPPATSRWYGWIWSRDRIPRRQRTDSLPLDKVDRSFWDIIKTRPNSLAQLNKVVDSTTDRKMKQAEAFFYPEGKKDGTAAPPPIRREDSRIEGEICLLAESPYRILRAAESGNIEDFSRLFLADPSRLNVKDSRGRAAVHQASTKNRVNILLFIHNHSGAASTPIF